MFQVDVVEFTTAIRNEFQFKVGCSQRFGPWLDWAERTVNEPMEKPTSFEHAQLVEQKACLLLKVRRAFVYKGEPVCNDSLLFQDVVKANKSLKLVQTAGEGIRGNMEVQDALAKLSERSEKGKKRL